MEPPISLKGCLCCTPSRAEETCVALHVCEETQVAETSGRRGCRRGPGAGTWVFQPGRGKFQTRPAMQMAGEDKAAHCEVQGSTPFNFSEGTIPQQAEKGEVPSRVPCEPPGEPGQDVKWRAQNTASLFKHRRARGSRKCPWAGPRLPATATHATVTHRGGRWCQQEAVLPAELPSSSAQPCWLLAGRRGFSLHCSYTFS